MKILEYKETEGGYWSPMYFPPTENWDELKLLADRWNVSIRLVDVTTGNVIKDYNPSDNVPTIGQMKSDLTKIRRHF